MKISIFVGHHKTGSTALQSHFTENRLEYLRQGVLYPMVEAQGMAVLLSEAIRGVPRPEIRGLNLREPHNALAFRMLNESLGHEIPPWHVHLPDGFQMFRMIAMQVEMLQPKHLVLCSEVFCRLALEAPEINLPRLLDSLGPDEIDLILTLRRPDTHITSWHLQRLKFGHLIAPLREGGYEEYLNGVHFQYGQIVEGFGRHAPHARLLVRNYDAVLRSGGSVADFLTLTGVPSLGNEASVVANTSVPHALTQAVVSLGHRDRGLMMPLIEHILEAGPRLAVPSNNLIEMYGPRHRAILCDAFAPIHEGLSAMAGRDFFPDIADMRKCRPLSEADVAPIALEVLKADVAEFSHHEGLRQAVLGLQTEHQPEYA